MIYCTSLYTLTAQMAILVHLYAVISCECQLSDMSRFLNTVVSASIFLMQILCAKDRLLTSGLLSCEEESQNQVEYPFLIFLSDFSLFYSSLAIAALAR